MMEKEKVLEVRAFSKYYEKFIDSLNLGKVSASTVHVISRSLGNILLSSSILGIPGKLSPPGEVAHNRALNTCNKEVIGSCRGEL